MSSIDIAQRALRREFSYPPATDIGYFPEGSERITVHNDHYGRLKASMTFTRVELSAMREHGYVAIEKEGIWITESAKEYAGSIHRK